MRVLLRPVCWRKGHAALVEQVWESMPFGTLVCSRCGKPASEETQRRFIKALVTGANRVDDQTPA